MYKQQDIVKENQIPEDECDVCYLHDKAYNFFKNKMKEEEGELCPHCNGLMLNHFAGYDGRAVVGGHNGYTPDESIGYYKVYYCDNCNKNYALIPQEIHYNGNHDIFYTGGKYFLSDTDRQELMSKIKEKMEPSISGFVARVQNGEKNLGVWNLQYWVEGSLERVIAEFLYERNLKC